MKEPYRLAQERKRFLAWWRTYDDRDEASLKPAWNAWKQRAGIGGSKEETPK